MLNRHKKKAPQAEVLKAGFVRGQILTLFGVHPIACFAKIVVCKDVFRG